MRNSQGQTFTERRESARRRRRELEVGNIILDHCQRHGLAADDFLAVPLASAILDYIELERVRDGRRLQAAPPSPEVVTVETVA